MKRDHTVDSDTPDNTRRPDETRVSPMPNGHTVITQPPRHHKSDSPFVYKPQSRHRQEHRLYPSGSLLHHQQASTRFDSNPPETCDEVSERTSSGPRKHQEKCKCCSCGCCAIGTVLTLYCTVLYFILMCINDWLTLALCLPADDVTRMTIIDGSRSTSTPLDSWISLNFENLYRFLHSTLD